jgi:hypothetical protein
MKDKDRYLIVWCASPRSPFAAIQYHYSERGNLWKKNTTRRWIDLKTKQQGKIEFFTDSTNRFDVIGKVFSCRADSLKGRFWIAVFAPELRPFAAPEREENIDP